MLRRIMVSLAVSGLVVIGLAAQPAAAAPLPDLQCGVNPTTSVRLREDLTCTSSFVIGEDLSTPPLSIDLGGHTLTITTPDVGCQASQPLVDPTRCAILGDTKINVRNGTVNGSIGLSSQPDAGRVTAATVNGDVWLSAAGGAVSQSTVSGTIHDLGSVATVHANWIRGGGIVFDDTFTGMVIHLADNHISDSPGAGISGVLGGGGDFPNDVTGEIAGNRVFSSHGAGIEITGALGNVGPLMVAMNRVSGSGGDGISLTGVVDEDSGLGGPVTVTANNTLNNAGHGIDASWATNLMGTAIVDGGGNLAHHNGMKPKCLGVVCG
jgi:hypothetical protein